jgi:hypothetical protein
MKPMIYLTREKNDLTGNEIHDLPHTRKERPDREWNPWFTSHERRTTWSRMKPMIYLKRDEKVCPTAHNHKKLKRMPVKDLYQMYFILKLQCRCIKYLYVLHQQMPFYRRQ